MDNYSIADLARFRIEQAKASLESSEILVETNQYKDAANRSYYCIFNSMRAVLAMDGFDSKKHSGIISEFRKRYIKTGKFPIEYSDMIKDAFDVRTDSDYQDFYFISKEDVQQQVCNSREFFRAVQEYLDKHL
jgi:uncharacterized protein (UPF0332 family)